MNWIARAIGWGIIIYAVMYLVWSGLVIYGLSLGYLSLFIRLATLVVLTSIAARSLRLADWKDVVPYSIVWAVVGIIFDALYLVPFSGWGLYASLSVWIGYALIVAFPILSLFWRNRSANARLS